MIILGINSAYHEQAAAILVDGQLVAAAEEERFNRVKHGKRARVDAADQLPWHAIAYCLRQAEVSPGDVDQIGYSFDPWARRGIEWHDDPHSSPPAGDFGTREGEEEFLRSNLRARERLLEQMPQAKFHFYAHHLSHAASAFLASPFKDAGILVVDGIGESASTWIGFGSGTSMTPLFEVEYPHSLGFLWEKICEFLRFDRYDGPGKVMALGTSGGTFGPYSRVDYDDCFASFVTLTSDGGFRVDPQVLQYRKPGFAGLERLFGPRQAIVENATERCGMAAGLQRCTEKVLLHLANHTYQRINDGNAARVTGLCMAGGVALNCVANQRILEQTPWESLWVQPAAHDAGTAVGAALLAWHYECGASTRSAFRHAYLGPEFDERECETALINAGLAYSRPNNICRSVATRIARGEVVGWFQGRMEFGPRALGNRSILADPSRAETRSRLNHKIKERESFRPFAPSLLADCAEAYFEPIGRRGTSGGQPTEYMLMTLRLKDIQSDRLPSVVQRNSATGEVSARAHLVEQSRNPLYAELLSECSTRVGTPAVLNTSFNVREPIVCRPAEACATLMRSGLDALALGPFLVERN